MRNALATSLLSSALVLAGATLVPGPEDLVRKGNTALMHGDFPRALELFRRAEERSTDPGLVAFNEALALYRLGRFRDAAEHFRRCLEDALGARRARLLYDLGNCLVQQAQGSDVRLLGQAVEFYVECLRVGDADPGLLADARHNLEVARLLWLEAKARKPHGAEDNESGDDGSPPATRKGLPRPLAEEGDPSRPERRGQGEPLPDQAAGNRKAAPAQRPEAGRGNLPPLPDDDRLTDLSPEEAVEYLRREAERIDRERREHRQRSRPAPSRDFPDW